MAAVSHIALLQRVLFIFFSVSLTSHAFEVTNTVSPVMTQPGCQIILTCGGYGDRIVWQQFADINPLQNTTEQTIVISAIQVENETKPYRVAKAYITATQALDNVRFQCFVYGSPPSDTTRTHQVRVRVNSDIVAIEPSIAPIWDISTLHEGDMLTIGCPVQTCAKRVSVQFLKGGNALKNFPERDTGNPSSAYLLSLIVSEEIRGTYACKVDTSNPDGSTQQTFEIIGTPMPPLPTTTTTGEVTVNTPTRDGTEDGTNGGGGTNGNMGTDGNDNDDDDSGSVVSVSQIPVLLVCLLFAISLLHHL